MKKLIVGAMSLFVINAFAAVDKSLAGIYKTERSDAELILAESGLAEFSRSFGLWHVEKIGNETGVFINFSELGRVAALKSTGDSRGLVFTAYSCDLEAAKADFVSGKGLDPRLPRESLNRVSTQVPSDLVEKARAYVQKMRSLKLEIAERNAMKEAGKREERRKLTREECEKNMLAKVAENPEYILTVPLVYPSKEDVKKVMGADFAYSDEMLALEYAIAATPAVFKESTLLEFLDKCDWDYSKGMPLVNVVTMRNEIGPEARRTLATRIMDRFADVKGLCFFNFFTHEKTPIDVVETAVRHPKINEELKGELVKYLERSKLK